MAIPAFIGDPDIGMALITEFSLIRMATHTGAVQTDGMLLLVARLVGSYAIPYDGEFPVLQKCLVVDPNEILRFDAFLFILFCRKLGLGKIAGFSAHRVMPDRISDQTKKDDQS